MIVSSSATLHEVTIVLIRLNLFWGVLYSFLLTCVGRRKIPVLRLHAILATGSTTPVPKKKGA